MRGLRARSLLRGALATIAAAASGPFFRRQEIDAQGAPCRRAPQEIEIS